MSVYRSKEQIIKDIMAQRVVESLGELIEYDYIGKTVKLNDNIYHGGELSKNFIEWLDSNKSKEFLVSNEFRIKDFYELEGVSPWIFNKQNLLAKCVDCGEYINMNLYSCKHCGKSYIKDND